MRFIHKVKYYTNRQSVRLIKKLIGLPINVTLSCYNVHRLWAYKWQHFFYHKKYGTEELMQKLKELGMQEGSCVFIQSSWDSFFNYEGNIKELIEEILNVIGPTGTLAMPAFPYYNDRPLDLKKSISGAGLIAEMFRRRKGVKRSINVQHSVCALGPLSDYLISEHHLCETCWDEKSPYYKLCNVDAIIFCIGIGYSFMSTSCHCVESINRGKVPYYTDFFSKEKTTHYYIDYDGIQKEYSCYDLAPRGRSFMIWPKKWFLRRYLTSDDYKSSRISNLTIMAYYAKNYIPHLINLGKQGIDVYRFPSKKGYKFENR